MTFGNRPTPVQPTRQIVRDVPRRFDLWDAEIPWRYWVPLFAVVGFILWRVLAGPPWQPTQADNDAVCRAAEAATNYSPGKGECETHWQSSTLAEVFTGHWSAFDDQFIYSDPLSKAIYRGNIRKVIVSKSPDGSWHGKVQP